MITKPRHQRLDRGGGIRFVMMRGHTALEAHFAGLWQEVSRFFSAC
jgi:hypothetical protein